MLLDIAIADAYGAGFEFAKPEVLARRPNDFTRYFRHNLDDNLPGMVERLVRAEIERVARGGRH